MDPFHSCSTQEWLSVPFHTHHCRSPQTQVWTEHGQLSGERNLSKGEGNTQNLFAGTAGAILVSWLWTTTVWGRGVLPLPNSGTFVASLCAFSLQAPSWIEDKSPKAETWSVPHSNLPSPTFLPEQSNKHLLSYELMRSLPDPWVFNSGYGLCWTRGRTFRIEPRFIYDFSGCRAKQ